MAYSKKDPPPNSVKPVSVQFLRHIASITSASAGEDLKSISDILQLTYFFLLRPGEYMGTNSPTTPFQLKDAPLSCGVANFETLQTPAAALETDTYGKLEFTTQKNSMKGEVMRHGKYGNTLLYPKIVLV